jgi:hypothetical protein
MISYFGNALMQPGYSWQEESTCLLGDYMFPISFGRGCHYSQREIRIECYKGELTTVNMIRNADDH